MAIDLQPFEFFPSRPETVGHGAFSSEHPIKNCAKGVYYAESRGPGLINVFKN
jgi:hypothetical protein